MIYIRTDANEIIGTGHVMRCLSIGEALRRAGGKAVFLAADSQTEEIVKKRGFPVICLRSVWNDLEQELGQLPALIKDRDISVLLIDSYYVTPRYLKTLRKYTKLVYIDDLETVLYPVDLLIRYAIYSEPAVRSEPHDRPGPVVHPGTLLGCRYIPLKSRFRCLPKRNISEDVKRILVLTGGTDPCHVALRLAEYVLDAGTAVWPEFDIVCGRYNPDYETLRRLAAGTDRIALHYNVEQMAGLMLAADLAVTAGGTTAYELCACGTPSVCYVLADNQIRNARTLAEKGLMLYGGDVRRENWMEGLLRQVDFLCRNVPLRKRMADGMQRLVDGKGAERIAEAVLKLQDGRTRG